VSCKYIITGNELRFDVRNYNAKETLIIDPTLIFVSMTGSTGSNWGFTATYGPDGSFYSGGINLQAGFLTSPGAFQTVWGGGTGNTPADISIMKLSPNGTSRIYATYIGGSGDEQPHSIVVDGAGNLILAGRTSSANYPTTGNGFFGAQGGGGYDIVVTKLNAAGTALIGSRKLGGTGDDGVNINPSRGGVSSLQQNYGDDGRSEVIIDGGGDIYVASCTRSNNFVVTPGVFQTTTGGGAQDGVVIKLNPTVSSLIFSSYLGGNADDAAYVLALDPNGNIYIGGGTASTDFPGTAAAGTISSSNNGGIDGFVTIISNSANVLLQSTYIGTSATDQVFGLKFDKSGFPYITGQTRGSWPVINATFSNPGAPQFIAKLQPNLSSYVYSTSFGRPATTPNISITAFLVDNCENVYVSGWGGEISSAGTNPITPDGHDFYFFVLKKNASAQLFGSYFGQNGGLADHVDGGTSRFDQQGVIYQAVCANCGGTGFFPTTPGAAYPNNGAASVQGCNLAMIKISFDFAGVEAGIISTINGQVRDTAGCAPLTVNFSDTVANAVKYYWHFGDGTPSPIVTVTPNINHTYNLPGTYRIMLISEDSTTCNIRDTAFMNIKVGDIRATLDFNPVKQLPCDSLKFMFDNLSTPHVSKPFTNQSFSWNFGDGSPVITTGTASIPHSYKSPGSYIIKLTLTDTGYCNVMDTVSKTLSIAPLVKAQFSIPPTGCVPFNAQFTNTSVAGQTYSWKFGDGGTSNAMNPSHIYNNAGTYSVTLIVNDPNTCNITDSVTKQVTLYNNPIANFSFSPDPPIENNKTTFTNQSSNDAINFKWIFGDGDSIFTSARTPVVHQYNVSGTFNACLIAINAAGCADTICYPVKALVLPLLDVPTAFTPNSHDINSKVLVKGFGIVKLNFVIWNRWGQKVFETNDKQVGWDGRYKGVLQPMDVYSYTLEAEFFDGKKAIKKGDITLIR
jgi:gliding motility-associated-like protein